MEIKIYFNNKLITNSISEYKCSKKNAKLIKNSVDFLSSRDNIISEFEKFDLILIENITSKELLLALNGIFKPINAAGGVVRNDKGKILMIYRNNMWDLPKGKQEKGEKIELCAMREVEEECGITVDELGDKICDTYHIYYMFEKWIIKRTHWYNMVSLSSTSTTPQIEEGITEIRWIEREKIATYAAQTYPTIYNVLKAADLL